MDVSPCLRDGRARDVAEARRLFVCSEETQYAHDFDARCQEAWWTALAKLEAASTCQQDSDCRVALMPPALAGGCYFPVSNDAFDHELSQAHREIERACGMATIYCSGPLPKVKCDHRTCHDPSLRLHLRAGGTP